MSSQDGYDWPNGCGDERWPTAKQIAERPPLYWEAVRYCEEHELPREDIERTRTMLAVQEFMRRIEPYQKQAARLMATQPGKWSKWIQSEGYVRADISPEMDAALKSIQDLIDREAERLGLVTPAR